MSNIAELVQKTKEIKTLYAEDEVLLRDETSRFLGRFFPSLKVCSNGQEAWEELEKDDFQLLITDLKMPVMDGIELIKKTKQSFPKVITIALSGLSDMDIEDLEVDYSLCKPVNINDFCNLIQDILDTNKIN